jgi:CheY-like chemotaxis protein
MAKVLLAEDDASMVYLLQTLLKMEGYEVGVLSLGDDPIAEVKAAAPDVLLMDVNLGGQSGIEIVRELRKVPGLEHTAIILSSGMPLEIESREAGATAFLPKPFMPDDLIALIRRHAPEAPSAP